MKRGLGGRGGGCSFTSWEMVGLMHLSGAQRNVERLILCETGTHVHTHTHNASLQKKMSAAAMTAVRASAAAAARRRPKVRRTKALSTAGKRATAAEGHSQTDRIDVHLKGRQPDRMRMHLEGAS